MTRMTDLRLAATGYGSVEGPTTDGVDLLFTDVHNGGIYRLAPDGEVSTVVPKRRGVGGLCAHADGGIVASGRDVTHFGGRGGERVYVTRESLPVIDGVRVGGFNDLCADWQGRVLVGPTRRIPETAIAAGSDARLQAAGEHAPSELVLITGPGEHTVLYADVEGVSNGIVVHRESGTIYHSESGARKIRVTRFVDDTRVEHVARWSTVEIAEGSPDGLALDDQGRLWVAMFGGGCLLCFEPDGRVADRIEVPASRVTNLCFAGPDLTELYVTTMDNTLDPATGGSIFHLTAPVTGAPVPAASV